MYRPLAALGLAGMIVLACVSLSKAEEKACVSPKQVISDMKEVAPDVKAGLVDADMAGFIMATLVKNGVEAMPYEEMVLAVWPNGKATIVLFTKGCATLMGSFPSQILGRDA